VEFYGIFGTERDAEELHSIAIRRDVWLALEARAQGHQLETEHLVSMLCEVYVYPDQQPAKPQCPSSQETARKLEA
jgi:hypothetical protein